MVGREVKIDRRVFTIKQGTKGPFDVLTFEEHGMSLGSLITELTAFLSMILHCVADHGTNGRNYWSSADMMYWIKIHKRSNTFGEVMQISWARKLRHSGKMIMELPRGVGSIGWKCFAIALDSLNQSTRNWGDDIFPSAYFAGKTRAYSDQPLTTTIDALGNLDTLGEWRSGIICNRHVPIPTWQEIGRIMMKTFNISAPFEMLPLDELRAAFFMEEPEKQKKIVSSKGISINNWIVGFTTWSPQSHKTTPLAQKRVFWISLVGVPLNLWTPEIIRNLSSHCGEFLMINAENLTLEEVSSIKVKVKNVKGPNDIPRVLKLQTLEGDYEIQVNIQSSGQPLSSPSLYRIMITEVEDDDLAAEVEQDADVDLSEETISDNWVGKAVSRQRIFKHVTPPSMRICTIAPVGDSYTTLTNSRVCTRKKRSQSKRRQKRKDRGERLVHKQWRWVPKIPNNLLGATDLNSNLNLNTSATKMIPQDSSTGSPGLEVPQRSYIGALLKVPKTVDMGASVIVPQLSSSAYESSVVKETYTDFSISNSQGLALRRLQIGLDVGMTFSDHGLQALELIERNIRRDEEAAENFNLRHLNPDIILTQGELLVEEDSETDINVEESDRTSRTPLAPFSDPLDSWSNSFLQVEYSNDSISIPPGFENFNHRSLRSLKTSLKNHHKNKKQLHKNPGAGSSKCARS